MEFVQSVEHDEETESDVVLQQSTSDNSDIKQGRSSIGNNPTKSKEKVVSIKPNETIGARKKLLMYLTGPR